MKLFYGIVFLDKNIDGKERIEVCSNNVVTERLLPPVFGACIGVIIYRIMSTILFR